MLNLREYRRHPQRLSDHLPWAILIGPGVMLNKDGSFQTTIRFRGPDVDSVTPHERMALRARMNNALRRLGSGWCLHIEASRRCAPMLRSSVFPNAIAQQIEDERRAALAASPGFDSTHYLTFTYLPPDDRVRRAANFLISKPHYGERQAGSFYHEQLEAFERQVTQIVNILSTFMPNVHRLDDDETLSYLHDCVSERRLHVRAPSTPAYIDEFLTDSPLTGGLSPRLGRHFLKTVSIRAFVDRTLPCLLDGLNQLPIEYRWCVRYLPMDKDAAEKALKHLRRHWYSRRKDVVTLLKEFITKAESELTDTDALNKSQELSEALEALGADCCSFGQFTLTITTWDSDERVAEKFAQAIQRVCDGVGLVSRIEDFNAVQAWFGSLPGHAYADVRRPILSSLSLCDLIPLSSVWSGASWNDHLNGPPLAVVDTTGSTPFRLNLHQSDVGHAMLVGPTGSGKSTFLCFLAAQFLRYPGAQVFYFDKGRSCQPMTLAMNGQFHDLSADAPTISFQPLGTLDADGELAWAHGWLIDLLAGEGQEMTPALKEQLWSALSNMATAMTVPHRTLTTLTAQVQSEALRQALRGYTLEGPYGNLLDADHDSLGNNSWQAFEMEGLMHSPALTPVLTNIFHRLEHRFGALFRDERTGQQRPRPTLLILDEAWLFLGNTTFAAKIREWLKTLRKKNVAVLFATQSLADIAGSPIAAAIMESCPTRIFLPNASAMEPNTRDLYRSFGLNDRQIAILQNAIPKRDYYYQSPVGNRLFQLGLGKVALAFCGGGAPNVLAAVPRLLEQHGADRFAEAYLREFGAEQISIPGETTND